MVTELAGPLIPIPFLSRGRHYTFTPLMVESALLPLRLGPWATAPLFANSDSLPDAAGCGPARHFSFQAGTIS